MMHGPGWQFPQRQNKICGTTNNISIKNLSQNPLRFPRKANRFRKEGNSGLPRGKMSSSVMGDGVLNERAGQFHDCAMSWEALTQSSDLSLENRTKRMCFTDRQRRQFYLHVHNRSVPNRWIRIANSCQRQWPWYRGRRRTEVTSNLALFTSHSEGQGFVP